MNTERAVFLSCLRRRRYVVAVLSVSLFVDIASCNHVEEQTPSVQGTTPAVPVSPTATPVPASRNDKTVTVTAQELAQAYEENEVAADLRYKDTTLATGKPELPSGSSLSRQPNFRTLPGKPARLGPEDLSYGLQAPPLGASRATFDGLVGVLPPAYLRKTEDWKSGAMKLYRRASDDVRLAAGGELNDVEYSFENEELSMVTLETYGEENGDFLLQELSSLYGEPSQCGNFLQRYACLWEGKGVMFGRDRDGGPEASALITEAKDPPDRPASQRESQSQTSTATKTAPPLASEREQRPAHIPQSLWDKWSGAHLLRPQDFITWVRSSKTGFGTAFFSDVTIDNDTLTLWVPDLDRAMAMGNWTTFADFSDAFTVWCRCRGTTRVVLDLRHMGFPSTSVIHTFRLNPATGRSEMSYTDDRRKAETKKDSPREAERSAGLYPKRAIATITVTPKPAPPRPGRYRVVPYTRLLERPDPDARAVASLQPDTVVHVTQFLENDWVRIESKTPGRAPGYLRWKDLKPIDGKQ